MEAGCWPDPAMNGAIQKGTRVAQDLTRWEQLQELFEQACALPQDRRAGYLQARCGGDDALRVEVSAMLAAESAEYVLGIERLVNDAAAPGDPFIGMRLGAWRIIDPIGRGGMGTVYLAERADGQYEQRVALKLVSAAGPGEVAALMFQAERRILARLSHPNIARLLDAGFTPEGSAYMVMELVDGRPFTDYCDTQRLGIDERLRLFRTVCDATQHAHGALIVHRDLKPSNIFVSREGQVKLLDFGIAKLLEPEPGHSDRSTRAHPALTLAYAAPEQLRGEPVTTATDVYALGVVLYELLAGRSPFDVPPRSPLEAERRIATTDPAPPSAVIERHPVPTHDSPGVALGRSTTPSQLAKRLRGDLDRIVLKALRREPERRYHSAGQLAEDIDRYLAGRPVTAQADSVGYRARRFVARNRLAVASASALITLLVVSSAVMAVQAHRIAAERDRARAEQGKAEQVVQVLVDLFQSANPDVVPGGDRLRIGDFLERAEARALKELHGQPELASRMRHVLGLMHHARSDNGHARDLLEAAFAERGRLSGADAPETLAVQVDLGRLLLFMDDRNRGRALLEDALTRVQRALGDDHPLAAQVYHSLGALERRWEDAHAYLERAVAIARRRLPAADRNRITYITSLGSHYRARGMFADARALFEEAQRSAEALTGGRAPVLVQVLSDFATLESATGDFAAAEAKYRRALDLAGDVVGPDSFLMADALNDLAVVLANQGRLREATDAFRESYDRHAALFGERHWRTLNAMRNVGMSWFLRDDPLECERWMKRAIDGHDAGGTRDRFTVYVRAQMARCVIRGGRAREGIAILDAAVNALEAEGPEAADYRANARLWLGTALLDEGQLARAETLVAAAVEYQRRARAIDHPARAAAECELAHVKAAAGGFDEALALAEGCVPRVAGYGQMAPWRRQSAEDLLRRLRADARPRAARSVQD
jgi:serine/threonine-protein kinase